ncbi:MFS transporter [Collinsella sp. An7]|uniref:MFS transporter n=1 Tax=Collinsella sp. An7 TaxID=1965651 RepID=UPI001302BCA1|nr:MFS transporter [Collinsella sp. An7]
MQRTNTSRLSAAQIHTVVTLGFCGLVSAADNWFVSPALPAIAQTLAVAPTAAMVILTAYMLPYGALQPVCGAIGDAVGRLRLLRVIVLGLCAGTLLCAVAPSLAVLVLARVVTGCFAAGIISVSQAFVGDAVGPECRAGAVGILMGITFTGQGLSAGLGGILTDLVGWRAAFAAFGALAFAAWLGLSTLREPALAPGAAAFGQAESPEAAEVPSSAPGSAAPGVPDAPSSAASAAPASSQPLQPVAPAANPVVAFFRNALDIFFGPRRAVFVLALATGILFLGTYGFMGTFLSEVCGLSSTAAGLLMMFYGVFCLVGGSLSGALGARRGLPGVIAIGEVSGIAAAVLLAVAAATSSWLPALGAAACLGLGYILVQPTLVTLSMEADPERVGLCTGLIGFGVFAGGGVGSMLGGTVLAAGGYLGLWLVVAALLLVQLIVSKRVL